MRQKTVKPWARDRDKLNKWVALTGRGQDTLSKARSFGLGCNTSTRVRSRRELLRAGSRPHYLVPPEMPVEGPSPTLVGSLGNSTWGKQGGTHQADPPATAPTHVLSAWLTVWTKENLTVASLKILGHCGQ